MLLSPRKQRHTFVWMLGLLALGWLAAFALTIWHMRADALENARATLRMHARNFEEHLTQTLRIVDLTASNVELIQNPVEQGHRLAAMIKPTPFIRSLSLINDKGQIFASSNPDNVGTVMAQTGFYPDGATVSDLLRIGRPWSGRDLADARELSAPVSAGAMSSGFVPVLRAVSTAHSTWMLATINSDYLVNHWTQLLEENAGQVHWLRYDDLLLATTVDQALIGAPDQAGANATRWQGKDHDVFEQTLPDGHTVLTAYRVSPLYPAVIAIHVERDQVLASWSERMGLLAVIIAPIALALSIAGGLLWQRRARILRQQLDLDRQRRLAESVFNASTIPTILTAPDGTIIAANPALAQATGYNQQELIGKNPRLFQSDATPAALYQDMWATINQGKPWRGELLNRKKDGSPLWEYLVISPVLDASGHVLHFIGSMEDISMRKRQMDELAKAKEAAEVANAAKSQFLTSMSHELRTPLNAILGYAQLIEFDQDLPPEKMEHVAEILRASHHLLDLINELLNLSRIESGKLELAPVPVQPGTIEQECMSLLATKATQAGLRLIREPGDAQDAWIHVDPLRLRQIIANLLSNAVKYNRPQGEVRLSSRISGQRVRISVTDTGRGIAPDKQSRIFTAFDRLGAEAGQIEGTGIGLLITKRITEAMGGCIGFESTDGQGSTFWVEFPLCAKPGNAGPESSA